MSINWIDYTKQKPNVSGEYIVYLKALGVSKPNGKIAILEYNNSDWVINASTVTFTATVTHWAKVTDIPLPI